MTAVYLIQCHSVSVARKIGRATGLRKLRPYRSLVDQCRRDQLAAILRRMRRDGLTRAAIRKNHVENIAPSGGYAERVDIETELNLFGDVVKTKAAVAKFETEKTSQPLLFGKSGSPGQRHLFADIAIPDDLTLNGANQ